MHSQVDKRDNTRRLWLAAAARDGASTFDVLGFFDGLDAMSLDDMIGEWKGHGLHTGHPLDGMLERFGWHGKRFDDSESAYPLLFNHGRGRRIAVNPKFIPVQLAARLRLQRSRLARAAFHLAKPLMSTKKPSARLRMTTYRTMSSATMIYDTLPMHDVFRRVDRDCLLGAMDSRYFVQPMFFVLERV
ncbi:MAG: hypothetical protein AVDCRST_MAG71-1876 [uncultured Lysobacter sp.]|uniref:DUF4334 domain-containing protein n=1 Tax=uncultured Lysobacter sp. TaxID=271060 RepID=A0A6J4LHI4_9GAMM|nr:MAG: hypothetical protein AVDCRST_MAG71-1876 [uncultured Lysobacter sp.]